MSFLIKPDINQNMMDTKELELREQSLIRLIIKANLQKAKRLTKAVISRKDKAIKRDNLPFSTPINIQNKK